MSGGAKAHYDGIVAFPRDRVRREREGDSEDARPASAAMTLDVYADLFDDDLDSVASRLDHAAVSTKVVDVWPNTDRSGASETPDRPEIPGEPGQ
jgi:hypothetical protein